MVSAVITSNLSQDEQKTPKQRRSIACEPAARDAGEEPALLLGGPRWALGEGELPNIADRCVSRKKSRAISEQTHKSQAISQN